MFFEYLSANKNFCNMHQLPPQNFTQLSCLYYWWVVIKKYKDGVDSSDVISMENLIKAVNWFKGYWANLEVDTWMHRHKCYTTSLFPYNMGL
jgi:hypothetical protein